MFKPSQATATNTMISGKESVAEMQPGFNKYSKAF